MTVWITFRAEDSDLTFTATTGTTYYIGVNEGTAFDLTGAYTISIDAI